MLRKNDRLKKAGDRMLVAENARREFLAFSANRTENLPPGAKPEQIALLRSIQAHLAADIAAFGLNDPEALDPLVAEFLSVFKE